MKLTKLQLTMKMFLNNPTSEFSNMQLSSGVMVDNVLLKTTYLTDNIKYLERIKLPTGRKMRFNRARVVLNGVMYTKYSLQQDLTLNELEWLSNSNNIKQVRMLKTKSKSLFDKIKDIF